MKRSRDERGPPAAHPAAPGPGHRSDEERVVSLIARIGERSLESIHGHVDGLARALYADIPAHGPLIVDTVLDACAALPHKTGIYASLCGLLNVSDPQFGERLVRQAFGALQRGLSEHRPAEARASLRLLSELACVRAVHAGTLADAFDDVAAAALDGAPAAGKAAEGALCRQLWADALMHALCCALPHAAAALNGADGGADGGGADGGGEGGGGGADGAPGARLRRVLRAVREYCGGADEPDAPGAMDDGGGGGDNGGDGARRAPLTRWAAAAALRPLGGLGGGVCADGGAAGACAPGPFERALTAAAAAAGARREAETAAAAEAGALPAAGGGGGGAAGAGASAAGGGGAEAEAEAGGGVAAVCVDVLQLWAGPGLARLREDNWEPPPSLLPRPWTRFDAAGEFDGATAHALPRLLLPPPPQPAAAAAGSGGGHAENGYALWLDRYAPLLRVRLFDADGGAHGGGGGALGSRLLAASPLARLVAEETAATLIAAFGASAREGAAQLCAWRELCRVEVSAVAAEAAVSAMLTSAMAVGAGGAGGGGGGEEARPAVYYCALLVALCRGPMHALPLALERAATALLAAHSRLDPACAECAAAWLAWQLSHFGFELRTLARPWAVVMAGGGVAVGGGAEEEGAAVCAGAAAGVRAVLDRCLRLSYHERVAEAVGAAAADGAALLACCMPPRPAPAFEFAPGAAADAAAAAEGGGALDGAALAALASSLAQRVKARADAAETAAWLQGAAPPLLCARLGVASAAQLGHKSLTHMHSVLARFEPLLRRLLCDTATRVAAVGAAERFWARSLQHACLLTERLLERELVDAQAVVHHCFAPERLRALAGRRPWALLALAAEHVGARAADARGAVRAARGRAERGAERGGGGEGGGSEVARCAALAEQWAREAKAFWLLLLQRAFAVLADAPPASAAPPPPTPADAAAEAAAEGAAEAEPGRGGGGGGGAAGGTAYMAEGGRWHRAVLAHTAALCRAHAPALAPSAAAAHSLLLAPAAEAGALRPAVGALWEAVRQACDAPRAEA